MPFPVHLSYILRDIWDNVMKMLGREQFKTPME